jgi:cbb3-type cytochrome oxidase subunit 3
MKFPGADNAIRALSIPFSAEGEIMAATPNTLGVMLLFAGVFLACILWASHGRPGIHDSEEEGPQAPSKPS